MFDFKVFAFVVLVQRKKMLWLHTIVRDIYDVNIDHIIMEKLDCYQYFDIGIKWLINKMWKCI